MSRRRGAPPRWFVILVVAGLAAVVALCVALLDPHIPFG